MFWRRDAVQWAATTKLLGVQQLGATPVNFNTQLGIYLLYDGREVIYIGRTTDRPLGRRLYEHTLDRLAARWDRFSWFGLLPVSDSGHLQALPKVYESAVIIPALEAILIEALEPRQNRKRGDDLSAVEFMQLEDPEIKKKRVRASLEAALDKM
ncbi:MAG: GIY-YIG nuclease family protein [Gammaproteobacteria bacterium]